MCKSIYIFNPEHDMALASASKFYMIPALIKRMKADLFMLPVWYANNAEKEYSLMYEDSLFLVDPLQKSEGEESADSISRKRDIYLFIQNIKGCFSSLSSFITDATHNDEFSNVSPWGWDSAILNNIESLNYSISSLPTYIQIDMIRELSSRVLAVKLLSLYNDMVESDTLRNYYYFLPQSLSLHSYDEVAEFISKYKDVMIKAPWSCSGRGVRRVESELHVQDQGWVSRIIRTQKSVVCEPFYNKVIDFAMEFSCHEGKVQFIGYSLFETDSNGAYKCNILDTDAELESMLGKYVSSEYISDVKQNIITLLTKLYAASYDGVLGVDMMICRNDEQYWIHPCVEVNLRMNMGIVARRFYDGFVSPESKGVYYVEHYFNKAEALENDRRLKEEYPLLIEDERIISGYMSLTPVLNDTLYQVYAILSVRR